MHLMVDISPCAYIASIFDYDMNIIRKYALDMNIQNTFINNIRTVLLTLKQWNSLENAVDGVGKLVRGPKGSIQHQLVHMQVLKRVEYLKTILKNPAGGMLSSTMKKTLQWWIANMHEESGVWTDIKPIYKAFEMSNKEFQSAFCYKFYLRIEGIVDGVKCNCSRKPVLDLQGHHLATCCAKGGNRIATHNGIVQEINNILHFCGCWTKLEDYGVFKEHDPEDNKRPDITIFNPIGTVKEKQLLDISIVTPKFSNDVAGTQANISFEAKMKKYKNSVSAINVDFVPIIFESNGYFHPTTWLKLLLNNVKLIIQLYIISLLKDCLFVFKDFWLLV